MNKGYKNVRLKLYINVKGWMIMYELVISFDKDDVEMDKIIKEEYGDSAKYEEVKRFDGLSFVTVVVPIAALTIQTIDFILTHFVNHSNEKRRVLIDSDGSMDLRGYSEEEARRIIQCYFDNKNDKE